MRFGLVVLMCGAAAVQAVAAEPPLAAFRIDGDAIHAPLAAGGADAKRGRDIVASRDGNCLLCHAIPETGARFMGDIAPPLSGVGARLSAAQLRLRVVDQSRLNPDTVMPSYYKVDGLHRVAPAFRGRPILSAAQVEDVVAFLQTLK